MIDFNLYLPTKIFFGKGKEKEVGKIIKNYGYSKILLVYGGKSIKESGLYEVVLNSLKENSISFFELAGIRANPTRQRVLEGLKIAKDNKIEMILAVGGGSVIDTSKSIAAGYYYDKDPFDFNLHLAEPKKSLPVGAVLTIAAAGSEGSNSCVISDDESKIKSGFNSEVNRPLFAIENPELSYTVNRYQTAAGITDIMMHTLERYFSESTSEFELADNLALGLLKTVHDAGKIAIDNPSDYQARATLMIASTISHNGLTSVAKNYEMPCHALEHALSAYDSKITHGAGLAVVFVAWAKYVLDKQTDKLARLAKALFNLECKDKKECAKIGIDSIQKFFISIGMPASLKEFGISKKDLPGIVDIATSKGTRVIGRLVPLAEQDIYNIYLSCLD